MARYAAAHKAARRRRTRQQGEGGGEGGGTAGGGRGNVQGTVSLAGRRTGGRRSVASGGARARGRCGSATAGCSCLERRPRREKKAGNVGGGLEEKWVGAEAANAARFAAVEDLLFGVALGPPHGARRGDAVQRRWSVEEDRQLRTGGADNKQMAGVGEKTVGPCLACLQQTPRCPPTGWVHEARREVRGRGQRGGGGGERRGGERTGGTTRDSRLPSNTVPYLGVRPGWPCPARPPCRRPRRPRSPPRRRPRHPRARAPPRRRRLAATMTWTRLYAALRRPRLVRRAPG